MSAPVRADSAASGGEVPSTFDAQAALKDAFFAALVALGLFGLIVGSRTDQRLSNEIVLIPRPGLSDRWSAPSSSAA